MSEYVLPVAFAVAGGVLTGGAMWGVAAGWMLGSWLFGPKADEENHIFDPGREELPQINQALRGVTFPVSFGTNRVPSNIVWKKNFTTIRHESTQGGGGGKGGGSGMGAKGGGPSTTQVSYEYKVDLLYMLGMSGENVSIFGGWLGSERLNGDTLNAILNNSNSGFNSFFRSNIDRPQNASLTFDEGFFHGANATGDENAENWDHFESEEGAAYRFPYTYYVGFKQLNLGGTARLPMISWEVGPGDVSITLNDAYLDYWDSPTAVSGNGALFKGGDGKYYQLDSCGGNFTFRLRNVTDNTTLETQTDTEFDAAATALGLDPFTANQFTSSNGSFVLPGKNKFIAFGKSATGDTAWAFILYEVDANGALQAIGGYHGASSSLEGIDSISPSVGFLGQGADSDPILVVSNSSVGPDDELFVFKLPSINDFEGILLETGGSNFDDRAHSLRTAVTEIQSVFGIHSSHRTAANKQGFIVPTVSIGLLGPVWGAKIMFYIGKSDIEWHIDNPGSGSGTDTIYDITGSYPNGGIFSVTVQDGLSDQDLDITNGFVDEAANFINRDTEETVLPFSDSGYREDGTEDDSEDYMPVPQVQALTTGAGAGGTLIVFWKGTGADSPDRADTGAWTKVRAFLWNPLAQIATEYAVAHGSFADTQADWGYAANNFDDYTLYALSGFYDEDTEQILVSGYVDGTPATDDNFASTFGDFNVGGGADVLPPFIIKQILTSTVYGLGLDPDLIDGTSYQLALQYCDDEDIRVSVVYRREEQALAIIDELLSLYGGFLIDSGGKIKFGLQKFTTTPLRTIDNTHLRVDGSEAPVNVTKGARQDTFNRIKVNYIDRDLEYRQNFVEIADEVDIDLHGTRPQEFPAKFVMTEQTANKIAIRALWSNLYARDVFAFKLGPKDMDLEPGDVITLVDSFHDDLRDGKQVRIVSWSEQQPMEFMVQAVEEVQYINEATLDVDSATEASSTTLFTPVAPPADFIMYELPKEFQGAEARAYVGYRQLTTTMGANLFVSADGESFSLVDVKMPYIISGIFGDALPSRGPGYVEESVEMWLMPASGFNESSPTFAQTHALDDVAASGRALGAGMIWANSEMMAYEGVNLIGQNHYRFDKLYRGWGGTHIQGHSSGDTWHKHGGGVFTYPISEDKIGSIIHYKVSPFNFAGQYYDIASIDARTYQLQGTYFRPQNQAPIRTFVQSPASFLTVQSEDLGSIARKQVIANGSAVQFEWPDASRDAGYGAQGYGTGTYGRFTADTTQHNWMVEVLSNDLSTVVRCTTVDTTAYLYDTDANSTDFNGWNGAFAMRVTPFNNFGTALRSRTKILELFE